MSKTVKDAHAKGSLAQSQMQTIEQTPQANWTPQQAADHAAAKKEFDKHQDTLHRASRIVDSIRTVQDERDANGVPTGRKIESIGAGASGRTKEEMRAFAEISDVYAGKYQEQQPIAGAPVNVQPAGNVEDAVNQTDPGRTNRTN